MNFQKAEANSKLIELSKKQLENKTKNELEQKQKHEELLEQRRIILKAILTPEAHERLSRIGMVKKEKATMIEDIILMQSKMGLFNQKITDDHLIKIIEKVSEQTHKKEPTIQIRRKKQFDDDDDDFNEEDYM